MLAMKTPACCGAILVVMIDTHQPSEGADLSQVRISKQRQTADAGWSGRLAMGRHRGHRR
jgi:hypothetical protein